MIISLAQGVTKAATIVDETTRDRCNTYSLLVAAWDNPLIPITEHGISVTWFPMGDIYSIATDTPTKSYTPPF